LRLARRALVLLVLPVCACTPLGAWIYDAPRFTVSEIHTAPPQNGQLAFEFVTPLAGGPPAGGLGAGDEYACGK